MTERVLESVHLSKNMRWPLVWLVVALVYFFAAKLGLSLAVVHGNVTAIWPPSGLALAVVLLFGYRSWPGVFLGVLVVNWLANTAITTSVLIATGNTLECLVGAYLVRRWCSAGNPLLKVFDVFKFTLATAIISTSISATIGSSSLVLAGSANSSLFRELWWTWWLGDAAGILVFTPVLLTIGFYRRISWNFPKSIELLSLFSILSFSSYFIFGGGSSHGLEHYPIAFVSLPLFMWAAYRFGLLGGAVSIVLVSGIAIMGTRQGYGPFALSDMNESLLILQTFIGLASLTTMTLAAAFEESRVAKEKLSLAHQDLEERVEGRTTELAESNRNLRASEHSLNEAQRIARIGDWDWNIVTQKLHWSDEMYRIMGISPHELDVTFDDFLNSAHPDDRKLVKKIFYQSLSGKTVCDFEHRIVLPDGTVRFVHEKAEVRCCDKGNPVNLTGTTQDITEQRIAQDKLRQAAKVFESTSEGVMVTDENVDTIAVNKAFTTITGYSENEVLGRNPRILQSGRHDKEFYQGMWKKIEDEDQWQGEIWDRRNDGKVYPKWLAISVVRNDLGIITNYVGVFSDISSIKKSEEQLYKLAHHDPLTNLPNRLLLEARLKHLLQQAQRHSRTIAVLFLDLDRFKNINDTLGHPQGDRLLQLLAERLQGCIREDDTVARLGGDELIIVLDELKEVHYAAIVAQNILDLMAIPFVLKGRDVFVSVSIGISVYPQDGANVTELLKNADAAMYVAKRRGRNDYHFYTEELTKTALESLTIETELHHALKRDEFTLHYQPQVSLYDGSLLGIEALIRWYRAGKEVMPPGKFIPLAEESDLIGDISLWVLREACAQAKRWQEEGLPKLRVAVNMCGRHIARIELVAIVAEILEETGLEARYLELEITEHSVMEHAEKVVASLDALRELGVAVAIDDFGTGYSSLSYLKRFSVDRLKIDRSFVRDITEDINDMEIARAIIALAKSLNLSVIAEGVETKEQKEILTAMGCDEMQGYLYCRPLPADELRLLLSDGFKYAIR